jgi:hypothetical protein
MQTTERHLEHLGKMVAAGQIDRDHVVERLATIVRKAGLSPKTAKAAQSAA